MMQGRVIGGWGVVRGGGVRCHMSSVVMIPHQMRCTHLPAARPCPMWPLSLDLSASGWGSRVPMQPPTCRPTSPPPTHVHHALRRMPACSCGLNKPVFTTPERETWGSGRKPGSNCFQAGLRVHEHERSAASDEPGLSAGGIVLYRHISCFPEGSVERLILLSSAEPY